MTLAQFVDIVRRRHNASSDTFWADLELYALLTDRINEVLSVIGLLEETTTDTSVASTQAYDFPSDAVSIRQVDYKYDRLNRIPFRKWEAYRSDSGTTEGRPTSWVKWNEQILLVPVPDTAGDTITIYYYKEHPFIDGSTQTTIDVPSVLHSRLVDGVLADMFVKELNDSMTRFYEEKWLNVHMPAFYKFKVAQDSDGRFQIIGDSDTEYNAEY